MANPQAEGRMINRAISDSDKFASLSPAAAVLFTMLIPWFNAHGKLNGGVGYIKDEICPKITYLTYQNIPDLLKEINDKTNVKWFQSGGRFWLHSLNFNTEHQRLDKKGSDRLPNYTPELGNIKSGTSSELVSDCSATSRNQVPPEIEEEREIEIEAEGKSGTSPSVDNSGKEEVTSKDNAFLKELKTAFESTIKRYPTQREQQEILVFIQSNYKNKNINAIIHCINSLVKVRNKVIKIQPFLESALKIENAKYNALDHAKQSEEFKNDKHPMAALQNLVMGMLKSIPEARAQ